MKVWIVETGDADGWDNDSTIDYVCNFPITELEAETLLFEDWRKAGEKFNIQKQEEYKKRYAKSPPDLKIEPKLSRLDLESFRRCVAIVITEMNVQDKDIVESTKSRVEDGKYDSTL